MSLALLVIDLQKAYFNFGLRKQELEKALQYINEASRLFRQCDKPVVIVQHTSDTNKVGTPGFDVVNGLKVEDTDYRITKTASNAFWDTELEELLKDLDVEFVICAGFAANHCVLFTYNGAKERGYKAAILKNGLVGLENKHVTEVEELRDTICLDTIEFMLDRL